MIFDEWRARGRAGAVRMFDEVRRRLGVPEALVPGALQPSPYTQPPEEFERPPARLKMAPARADERAIGWRDAATTAPAPRGPRVVALHFSPSSDDWRAVAAARPQFDGHAQPRLPELGFYSTSAATLRKQIALAEQHGIGAFAFVVGLDEAEALEAYLADSSLSFPYCVAWLGQGDRKRAIVRLRAGLADPRCLRIDGQPVLLTSDDAMARALRAEPNPPWVVGYTAPPAGADITARQELLNPDFDGRVLDGRLAAPFSDSELVAVARDSEPCRVGAGRIVYHDSPRLYRDRLAAAIERTRAPLLFIDAWNDWLGGAVLEPDARLGHAWLRATRDAIEAPPSQPRPVAVVHAYHVELLDEIIDVLRPLSVRLIVTTTHDRQTAVRAKLASLGAIAEVEVHENRGRDILPFLRVANRLLDEGVELVLKLHTKSSGHRVDGARWRAELIGRLVEPGRLGPIQAAFADDARLGCVAPEGHHLPLSVYWGWNEETVRHLCVRMGVADPDLRHDRFCAGSMFWVRLAALRPLLDAHLGEWEFASEGGFVDGTMAHGIERALGLAVQGAGFVTRTAASVCGLPFDDDAAFAYAEATGSLDDVREG